MRIRKISIGHWRHFEQIELSLEEDAPLVCIVGANGTGKSHLLELIGACAHRLGLSQGIDNARGDPFSDPHDFSLQFFFAKGVSAAVDDGLSGDTGYSEWDRTITIQDSNRPGGRPSGISAGGIADLNVSAQFASRVVNAIRQSQEVHFVSLDADRAYPKRVYNIHEIAQAYEIDWEGPEYTRGRAFRSTATLYDEWIKYFLAQENQAGTQLMQETRRAIKRGAPPPVFTDHFAEYSTALQKVLPHLVFIGVDAKQRTLMFDTTGMVLSFHQLSGGEREIAFLVGQIDRFGLRKGLFLIDEPELHLNADLIRTWVAYLTSTVLLGQIWLATHSLEAVETAGQHATFILERNEATRKVDSLARLDARPVLSALSRAVGTPAFSISKLKFVFVEGEEGVGERERFRNLTASTQSTRLMECGSGNEVIRRVSAIKGLAREAEASIRIGGVVDRDFRSNAEIANLQEAGVFVLPVHEVENLFLHPATLASLRQQNGIQGRSSEEVVRDTADSRAGAWVFQHCFATPNAKGLPEIASTAKERAKNFTWRELEIDSAAAIQRIVDSSGFGEADRQKLKHILGVSVEVYRGRRIESEFWKSCEGKQVLTPVARALGFSGTPTLVAACFALWQRNATGLPAEVAALRNYIAAL